MPLDSLSYTLFGAATFFLIFTIACDIEAGIVMGVIAFFVWGFLFQDTGEE